MFNKGYIICKDQYEFELINYWIKLVQNKLKSLGLTYPVVEGYERTFKELQEGSLLPKNIVLQEGVNADVIFVCFGPNAISWSNIIPGGIDRIYIDDIPEISSIYTQKVLKTRLTNLFSDAKTIISVKNEDEANRLGLLLEAIKFYWGRNPSKSYLASNCAALKNCAEEGFKIKTSTGTRSKDYPNTFNEVKFEDLLSTIGFDEECKLKK